MEKETIPEFKDLGWNTTASTTVTTEPEKEVKATDIWLQFNTVTVGTLEEEKETFDLKKILRGLEKLADNFTEGESK